MARTTSQIGARWQASNRGNTRTPITRSHPPRTPKPPANTCPPGYTLDGNGVMRRIPGTEDAPAVTKAVTPAHCTAKKIDGYNPTAPPPDNGMARGGNTGLYKGKASSMRG